MPKKIAPNLGLPYGWERGEDHWGGPMSDSQVLIDTLLNLVIKSLTVSAPPPDAKNGDVYSIAANPTGVWAGHAGDLALYIEQAWVFWKPKLGWRAYAESYREFVMYDGTTWVSEAKGEDPTNPDPDPNIKPKWFDISATVSDTMYADEPIIHMPILDPMILPANMVGSAFDMADGSSPAYFEFRVQRNGQNMGTMTVDVGNFNAVFSTVGGNPISFAAGDRLTVRAQKIVVDTMKNFGFVIRMGLV